MAHRWVHLSQLLDASLYRFFVRSEHEKARHEIVAQLFQMRNRKVVVAELTAHGACIRALQRVRMQDIKISTNRDTTTRFFFILHLEATVVEVESITVFVEKKRQNTLRHDLLIRVIVVASKHEDVFAPRMAMEICVHVDHSVFLSLRDHLLGSHNFWSVGRRVSPLPVQIEASQAGPLVSVDDSVRVQHRHDLEDEVVSQELSTLTFLLKEEVHCSLEHVRGNGFARVSTSRNHDRFSPGQLLLAAIVIRNNQLWTIVACNGLAEHTLPGKHRVLRCAHLGLQIVHQVSVCVWVAVCDVHLVSIVVEDDFEGQRRLVARNAIRLEHMVLEVLDIEPIAIPSDVGGLGQRRRVKERLHALLVLAVVVLEVIDIEPVLRILHDIGDPEVEPLLGFGGARIALHVEVVLVLADTVRLRQIAGFESALEHERVIVLILELIVWG